MFLSVGLDVQSEYLFRSLEPLYSRAEHIAFPTELSTKKTFKKQTTITDTFKERKRKLSDLDVSQSKEKKKRDYAVIEKIRHLKEPFGKTSIELRDDRQKSKKISNKLLDETMSSNKEMRNQENSLELACGDNNDYDAIVREYEYPEIIVEDLDSEHDFIADDHLDNILNEIENEISRGRHSDGSVSNRKLTTPVETTPRINNPNHICKPNYKSLNLKRPTRCNYNFIELLERNENLSDEDDTISKDGGFSDTIKGGIEKFFMSTSDTTKIIDPVVTELINNPLYSTLEDEHVKTVELCVQNNKEFNKGTALILKSNKKLDTVPGEPVRIKENDDITTGYPEVAFGKCSSNDVNHRTLESTEDNNKNYCIQQYTPSKANLVDLVNHRNNFTNRDNIKPEMCVVKEKELLKIPYDLKKSDHHHDINEKCHQKNNLTIAILEQGRNVEIIHDDTNNVGQDSQEKYFPGANHSIALIPSEYHFKQNECTDNSQIYSYQLLPNMNIMSMNTWQSNATNAVDKLNQASILKTNGLEKESIVYFDEHVGGDKYLKETIHNTQPLPFKTIREVNINRIPSLSEKSLQKTTDENWDNLKLDNDSLRKEQYVNKYSFSTTKVDVQTKKHADLQVQIIRKLKINVDVTEILTRDDTDVQKDKGKPEQTSNCVDNRSSHALEVPNYLQKPEASNKHDEGMWPQLVYKLDPMEGIRVNKSEPKNDQQVNEDANVKELTIIQAQTWKKPQRSEDLKDKLVNVMEKYSKILR